VTKMLWKESDRGMFRPDNNLEVIVNEGEIRSLLDTVYIHKLKIRYSLLYFRTNV
jgi:hypothetical protein